MKNRPARRAVLLAALLAASVLTVFEWPARAQTRSTPSPSAAGPEAVVRQFYAWYTGRLDREDFNPLKQRRAALRYLTPAFHRRVPRLTAEMGADVFICAQDWQPGWGKNLALSAPVVRGARATTFVTFDFSGADQRLRARIELRRVGGEWKIDGADCAE